MLCRSLVAVFTCLLAVYPVSAFDLSGYRFVDLSHTYDDDTLFWPTSPTHFDKETVSEGQTEGGWFYSAYSFCTPEHGGTHLDAPRHFHAFGQTADAIPLNKLITPLIVIDVRARAGANRDYRLEISDIEAFEETHGRIPEGSTVVMFTGWSDYWPDAKRYLGDDTPGDASKLSFPSFGLEASRHLIEGRGVVGLGIDTASIDYGRSHKFPVHRLAGGLNVVGLENLTGLAELPPTGAVLMALPMKIGGGSGGPARIVAMVPHES